MNDQLLRLLGRTTHISHRYMGNMLEQYGLTRGQPRVLRLLALHPSMTQKELITHMDIRPATLTRMLQRMESNQLITRTPSTRDQRVMTITLTEKGKEAHLISQRIYREMEAEFSVLLTDEEQVCLQAVLTKLCNYILEKEEEEKS